MKKGKLLLLFSVVLISLLFTIAHINNNETNTDLASEQLTPLKKEEKKKKKKTVEERRRFAQERIQREFDFQVNPETGQIPFEEKQQEIVVSKQLMDETIAKNSSSATYVSRGPSNLGGRTRSLVIDRSDATSNTIIAGGVSSGVFRTTNGGGNWTKVSANNQIHNATSIAQDPRAGSENIWYYGTGELSGNSASGGGAFFFGQGIWQSTDGGLNWTQMPSTASSQTEFDSTFDIVNKVAVHPITGEVFAATIRGLLRFNGTDWVEELSSTNNANTDVVISSTGIVYASFDNNSSNAGVWQSPTGTGSWTRIAQNGSPIDFDPSGRIVLSIAPSNEDIVYIFYTRDTNIEAGLWQFNDNTDTFTDYTSKMPDEPGGDLGGNDPIAVQGGYDLIVNVKPDDPNFVVIGGTNAYKIEDIVNDVTFTRIGGYRNNQNFALYDLGVGGDRHHPDIHALVFDPNNTNILFSGTDGGVHRTDDITAGTIAWTNLNNNYQTYQFYHVATDPTAGSDIVIGGAQDNGTTGGGTSFGQTDLTSMFTIAGGDGVAVGVAPALYYLGFQLGPVFRVSNTEFTDITPDGIITPAGTPNNSQFVTYFYLDPSNNNALYYAGLGNMYRTTDAPTVTANTWTNLGAIGDASASGNQNERISQYAATWGAYNAASSYLLIGGNAGTLLRLNDPQNAASIVLASDITPAGANGNVSGIAVHPTNPDIVLLTYSNYGTTNIYLTSNATAANPDWNLVERNLNLFSIRSAAITEIDGEANYYVGTARGLFSSLDPLAEDWTLESPDQIGFALVSALAYKPSNNTLLIGTHGNGMYEATVTPSLSVPEFDSASNSFVAYPIPAASIINIDLESSFAEGDLTYSVADLNGRVIKTGTLNSEKQINVEELTQGLYVLQLASSNRSKAITFIKN
ncbi:T9SS type A sorting domain-containing protein [Aquimarina sp. 2201CG5-10]|uniref:T9SS type A sorting domain-containing protein n=1 Tax=Aquimarina callyspongiae TaxID=3098150 RepID=UPI002AB45806|nr:T9SS type A sorting domain-containing protein [Aquimarina sp. 2201CG5-10]MDY8135308.1 T9SS type A sorting domain-containing protein [Aquimarina sp. 2201CG5-10]